MKLALGTKIYEWLVEMGLSHNIAYSIKFATILIVVIGLAFLSDYLTKKILLNSIGKIVRKSKTMWDDIFIEKKVLKRLAHIAPAVVIYYYAKIELPTEPHNISALVQNIAFIYMIFIGMLVIDAFLNSLHDIYQTLPISKNRPIKGYIQVVKIIINSFGVIMIFSIILGESPKVLLTSLGAVAAILLLVFKDTILGFVSSIQLSANHMVKPGDWITMPSRNADGNVIEITLNTVKIQNFDKTIVTVPTYALVSESFQNWEGMENSKGRRIKRSVFIDVKTVKFCDAKMLDKFKKIHLLKDYIENKQVEIEKHNIEKGIENDKASRRNLTNLGVFRIYVEKYLDQHPAIYPNGSPYTAMVRHLDPTEKGIPVQIYCFSKIQAWVEYEQIQADIFDHILAVVTEFDLAVFQNPTGNDFQRVLN